MLTTKFFEIKRAELNEKEENLKEKLKTEVTKIKESLDDYLTQIEYLSKSCERIKKGVQALEKEEKYIIKKVIDIVLPQIKNKDISINQYMIKDIFEKDKLKNNNNDLKIISYKINEDLR